jgi:hypothetical protein
MAIRLSRKNGPPPLKRIDLGLGVVLVGRAVDRFGQMCAMADAETDLGATFRGEPTKHDWIVVPEEVAALVAPPPNSARAIVAEAMFNVLVAWHFINTPGGALEGIEDDGGAPIVPTVGVLDEVFRDVRFTAALRRRFDDLLWTTHSFDEVASASPASAPAPFDDVASASPASAPAPPAPVEA